MNIGIVTMWFERGAAYVSRQYRELLKDSNEVFIYARTGDYPKNDPNWQDSSVYWGKRSHLPVPTAINQKDFLSWVHRHNLDLILFNEQQWWEPLFWCSQLGVKTGAYIDYYTEETVPFFASYDFLICNTRRHYEAFSWHPQAFYVPWGTDISLFKPQTLEPVVHKKVTFFHSCGYSPLRKGTDFVLDAFAQMTQPARLIIHTQIALEKAMQEQKERIDILLQRGSLEVIKKTVGAPGLYHLGDVYVGPSRLEGIGLPLLESQACGLPLITCNNGPMNEFVTEEVGTAVEIERLWSRKDGYYWPQCQPNVQLLAKAMDQYASDLDAICQLKKAARTQAENRFNWQDRTEQLLRIFSQVQEQGEDKAIAAQNAMEFEQSRQGIQYRFSRNYPLLWRFYQLMRNH